MSRNRNRNYIIEFFLLTLQLIVIVLSFIKIAKQDDSES